MKKSIYVVVAILFTSLLITGCGSEEKSGSEKNKTEQSKKELDTIYENDRIKISFDYDNNIMYCKNKTNNKVYVTGDFKTLNGNVAYTITMQSGRINPNISEVYTCHILKKDTKYINEKDNELVFAGELYSIVDEKVDREEKFSFNFHIDGKDIKKWKAFE